MSFGKEIDARLQSLREAHRYRELTDERGLSFSHNDYLGISDHPAIIEAGKRALAEEGAGSRGSRLLGGNRRTHEAVEGKIAAFFGSPAALFFSTGYLANLAVLQALGPLVDSFVSDERNHASLIDGMRLANRPKAIVPHQRWDLVPEELRGKRLCLVAESLYSMDGDFIDENAFRSAADRLDAFLVIDESHAGGVFFEDGCGVSSRWRDWERTAVVVTFGKAFGVAGAAVLGSRRLCDLLVNTARSFIFTTAPPPAVAAMVGAALDVVATESWRRSELWSRGENIRRILRDLPTSEGVGVPPSRSSWDDRSPIVPFLVPGDDRALRLAQSMRDSGWNLRAIRYPTVALGAERLRISLSLRIDRETTEHMARELGLRWQEWRHKESS